MDSDIKVLVVDNSAPMRRSIRGIFSQIGFKNIIWAGDGSEALEKLGKEKVGLIVSDWDMPKMNGLELMKGSNLLLALAYYFLYPRHLASELLIF